MTGANINSKNNSQKIKYFETNADYLWYSHFVREFIKSLVKILQPKQLSVGVESQKDRKCTIMRRLAAFSLHFVLRRDF